MSCRTLVNELGLNQPKTPKELLDITKQHTFGEDEVGPIFVLGDGTMVLSDNQGHHPRLLVKALRKVLKAAKRAEVAPLMGHYYHQL
jgi:hypothetical protein